MIWMLFLGNTRVLNVEVELNYHERTEQSRVGSEAMDSGFGFEMQ
jgi:hypothetical protein